MHCRRDHRAERVHPVLGTAPVATAGGGYFIAVNKNRSHTYRRFILANVLKYLLDYPYTPRPSMVGSATATRISMACRSTVLLTFLPRTS